MKALVIIVMMTLYAGLSYGQGETMQPPVKQPESVIKLRHDPNPYPHQYNENFDDMCLKYRGIRNGGIVMMVLGGGLIATGAILVNHHDGGKSIQDENGNYKTNGIVQTAGKATIAVGALSLVAGIPMTAFGAVKSKRACGYEPPKRSRSYLQLQSGENGLGMAVKF